MKECCGLVARVLLMALIATAPSLVAAGCSGGITQVACNTYQEIKLVNSKVDTIISCSSSILEGDVTGPLCNNVVRFVGGQSAIDVAAATLAVQGATPLNFVDTLVLRDGVGNFGANMITLEGVVTNPTDAATKAYVDAVAGTGLIVKDPAQVVSLTNVTLVGTQTIDGVVLVPDDRVLLVGQSNPIENGLWLSEVGTWSRPLDFASGTTAGAAYVLVSTGSTQGGSSWVCTSPAAIIDVNPLTFAQFALAQQTNAANVGTGEGEIFRNKTGLTLNFKTLAAVSHTIITNGADEVTLATDATAVEVPNTIVSRDASGIISASAVRLVDALGNYVGLSAPLTVSSNYTVGLPPVSPLAGQVLQTLSANTTQWATIGGLPAANETYYVSLAGNDSNDGSLAAPFRTVAHAVAVANTISSATNPIAIHIGEGFFVENNSGGPLTITADGISIIGNSIYGTTLVPTSTTIDFFSVATTNVEFANMALGVATVSSSATAVTLTAGFAGYARFNAVAVVQFGTAFAVSSAGGFSTILFEHIESVGCSTSIAINNVVTIIRNSIFSGPLAFGLPPVGSGITVTGVNAQAAILSSVFNAFDTGAIAITGGAQMRVIGCDLEASVQGIICSGGSRTSIEGCNFLLNTAASVNVAATGASTVVNITGCNFNCNDLLGAPAGTALQATNQANLFADSCAINKATVGIQCGTTGDLVTTVVRAIGIGLLDCTTDISQVGTSKLHFVGGTFEGSKISIANPTNVSFAAFDSNGEAILAIGNATDNVHAIYRIENGEATPPNLTYNPNYYGQKGTVYLNPNAGATFNATQAQIDKASYFVVTGDRAKEAALGLISDTGNFGVGDFVRGWSLTKTSTQADLAFTYSNNDTSGLAARGANSVMNLNGFDNQVEFPAATNAPLPTNAVAKLVWAGDTNLYRDAANTLKTDDNLVVATLTPAGVVHNDAAGLLSSSLIVNNDISALAAITDNKLATISTAGKVANSATTATAANTPNTIVLRDATGNFAAGTITADLIGNASTATTAINTTNFTGLLSGDVTGTQGATVVSFVGGQTAANVAAATVAANAATNVNTPSTIVKRDASGNFSAGVVTASLVGNVTGNLFGQATTATTAISATNFTGSLVGDVTGTQGATVVSTVGGQSAANVASATIAANAATPTNTANTIVKRDASGNFEAGTIIAHLTGNVTGNLFGQATTATTANSATNFTGSLAGDVSGTQGATVVNMVGGQTAAAIAAAALLANAATSANTPSAIVRRDASGNFSAGIITANLSGNVVGDVTGNLIGNATTATSALTANSATNFTGPLAGDVTGNQSATIVSLVGGKTATMVASTVDVVNSATSNNMANTLVLRDSLSNFSTNMITIGGTVTNPTDVTTKAYVDAAVSVGFTVKDSVLVTSLTNVSLTGTPTIDGVVTVTNDRVLLAGQTNPIENGLWLTAVGTWTRPLDFASGTTAGTAYVLTTSGLTQAGNGWVCSTPSAIIDTDPLVFAQFSIAGQTTAANVGTGAGQLFRDKTGQTINLKTIAAGTHMVVTNNTNEVTLSTDATSANTPNTLVSRDASGNFNAGTISAALTGSASLNVLKAGDTMTGNLNMAAQSQVRFEDAAGGEYVGLSAPTTVTTSYSVELPEIAPLAGQVLQALSANTTQWATVGGLPTANETYYVSLAGNDSNDGSFAAPFRTVSHAVNVADGVSSASNPIAIKVGEGFFVEDNTGGPLTITADGISIIGNSIYGTTLVPTSTTIDFFSVATSNVEFANLALGVATVSSSATAVTLTAGFSGYARFNAVAVVQFGTAFVVSSAGGFSTILFEHIESVGCSTSIAINNVVTIIRNSIFSGPLAFGLPPVGSGITVTGMNAQAAILSSVFNAFDTGAIAITGGAQMRVIGCDLEASVQGVVCSGGSRTSIEGCNFLLNTAASVNVAATGANTVTNITGCNFNCNDLVGAPAGTALQATNQANLFADSCAINKATVGIQCGTTGDLVTTIVRAIGIGLLDCTTDISQVGTSKLHFVGGTFEASKISIADPTNVSFAAFDSNGEAILAIGNTTDSVHAIYRIENGDATPPNLTYNPNYYGYKGTVYLNPNADPTFNATQAQSNDAAYYVVTGDRAQEANLNLISDTGSFGVGDNVRGWSLTKTSTQADLAFTYSNNDTSGLAARGANSVMNLNGFDNQVEFPAATNAPLPTNAVAKLVWAGDTNLYRDAANTLKTDDNMVIATLTPAGVVHNDAAGLLSSSLIVNNDISASAGITDNKLATISTAGKVANSATTATTANTPNTIVLRDASGNFSAGIITANLNGNATTANSATQFTGVLSGDVTGTQGATVVNTVGGQTAANVAAATVAANAATNVNTPSTIVKRDASGNFSAGVVTASLVGNVTGNLFGQATTATTAISATNFTGSLVGDVTGTQGATVVSTVGGQSAANVAAATIAANAATPTNTPSTIVRRDASGNFIAGTITANLAGNVTGNLFGNATTATTANSATNFTGSLSGNVTGNQSSTVVSTVGGQTAANVAAATLLANAATSANTASAIVRRDASGNFSAGTITASLTGAASSNVLKAGDTMTGTLTLPAGSIANPSLLFSGSTTGLTAPVANSLYMVAGGVPSLGLTSANIIAGVPFCEQSFQTASPTNAGSVTTSAGTGVLLLSPASNVTNYTINFPPNPITGQHFTIIVANSFSISSITNNGGTGGATVVNPVVTLAATAAMTANANGAMVSYFYYGPNNAWYRAGRG